MTEEKYGDSYGEKFRQYEDKIKELEKEKCELLGIIQGKDKAIQELEKKNTKLQQACHKWFMRWREAKKDALYFDSSLQKQIQATLKLQQENAELKKKYLYTQDAVTMQMYTNKANKEIADKQLTKAKEIIRCFVVYEKGEGIITNYNNFLEQAEQFIKE